MTLSDRVLIFDADAGRASSIAEALKPWGLAATHHASPSGVAAIAEPVPVAVLIVEAGEPDAFAWARSAARSRHVPTLALVEPVGDPQGLAARVRPYDDWVALSAPAAEIAARILALARPKSQAPVIDPRFLALAVHDLRTPLNVIGLTIRAIGQSAPVKTPDFEEDLTFLQENARQIERMLAQLGDFCHLLEIERAPVGVEFDFCRYLGDFVEDRLSRSGSDATPIQLDFLGPCPREVSLDTNRTRVALQHAVANAVTATGGTTPVRIEVSGTGGRLRIAIVVDKPPPATVQTTELRPDLYERLAGSAAERRGLDLAIAARISHLFGGTARLEVDPGQRTTVVLDWPERLAPNA